ncbi:MAG TPA: DUF2628 domain-containing protein [Rhodopila sp.]|nr:DUF2628 domain-containing protein [Rhodopila sp.]
MRIYTALLKDNAEPALVREGFSWGALILGPFWLAAHRAWIAAALSLAAYALIAALAPTPANAILALGLAAIIGLTGNDLRRWSLENRGYLLVHVLRAGNRDDAFTRLLTHRPDLARHLGPEPV